LETSPLQDHCQRIGQHPLIVGNNHLGLRMDALVRLLFRHDSSGQLV